MIKPQLFLFGEELTYTNEAVFLGVKFNSSLTWEPQIRALIAKAQPRLNLIKALVSSCGHNNNELLLRLYMAIVRPIFEYSSIAHVNAAACHHCKLQQIQNTAIRVILKIPNYIHTDFLHDCRMQLKIFIKILSCWAIINDFIKQTFQSKNSIQC